MKIVIIGNGQLGSYVYKHWDKFLDAEVTVVDYPKFDITNQGDIKKIVSENDVIINCAAYTNVDKAETDRVTNMNVNAGGPISILSAIMLKDKTKKFIHISSEVVYGSNDPNYGLLKEDHVKTPTCQYALSKKLADDYIEEIMKINENILIIRPGWLFGPKNDHNFIEKIRTLLLNNNTIKVVDDQIGSLTSVDIVLKTMKCFLSGKLPGGTYNLANAEIASRYENACYVKEVIGATCNIVPCSSGEFKRAASVAKNSSLDCSKIRKYIDFDIPSWKEDVRKVLTGEML